MKKDIKLKVTTFICAALLVLSGCKDESYPDGPVFKEDEGGFSMKELALDVKTDVKQISRGSEVDCSNYDVKIVYASSGNQVGSMKWKYGKMPEIITLMVGKYRIEVESCDWSDKYAEWDLPHYVGSYDFEIKAGQITKADKVPCELKNVKVTVEYSESLMKILNDTARTEVVAGRQIDPTTNKAPTLHFYRDYNKDDSTKAGYFKAEEDSKTLVATLRYYYMGEDHEVVHTMSNVQAGQHHIIKYEYKNSDPDLPEITGTASRGNIQIDVKVVTVNVDGTISIKEVVLDPSDRPGKEDPIGPVDPINPDDPTPPTQEDIIIPNPNADGNKPYFDLDKINEVRDGETTGREYKLTITSKKGFSSLKVQIKSHENGLTPETLEGVNLASEFDLATGKSSDGRDISEGLEELKFPIGTKVTEATKVDFNITQFVPLLTAFPGDHSFILTVTDKEGKSKQVELKFRSFAENS
ncbi:MAG: DUF4493 domain-containing protein [Muribaculaceae bacterium]|nr:DUF4493 domain-containing protein [Muribaculaceae bacterium]